MRCKSELFDERFHQPTVEQTIRVLYVDSDENDVFLTRAACDHCQAPFLFQVETSTREAISLLKSAKRDSSTRPDFILLDVMTEGQSGFELLEFAQQTAELKSIPVIVLTAATDPALLALAWALGAKSVLPKIPGLDSAQRLVEIVRHLGLGTLAMKP